MIDVMSFVRKHSHMGFYESLDIVQEAFCYRRYNSKCPSDDVNISLSTNVMSCIKIKQPFGSEHLLIGLGYAPRSRKKNILFLLDLL